MLPAPRAPKRLTPTPPRDEIMDPPLVLGSRGEVNGPKLFHLLFFLLQNRIAVDGPYGSPCMVGQKDIKQIFACTQTSGAPLSYHVRTRARAKITSRVSLVARLATIEKMNLRCTCYYFLINDKRHRLFISLSANCSVDVKKKKKRHRLCTY